jgi:hypothetical protein
MDIRRPVPSTMPAEEPLHEVIHFPNGNTALAVTPAANTPTADILHALSIQSPKALFMVIGGAEGIDDPFKARLKQLCSRGIARVAAETGAAIIDGGTEAGIMQMMGQAVADRGRHSPLLGVAPARQVTYPGKSAENSLTPLDPNHSHFVLSEGNEWGDETNMMYMLASALGQHVPVVVILANGGSIAKREALCSVQHQWPIIVIQGSGRTADEIAHLWEQKDKNGDIPDPELAEIIEKGTLHLFPLEGSIEDFEKLLKQALYQNPVLRMAWERFALYDANAVMLQQRFDKLQPLILIIRSACYCLRSRPSALENVQSSRPQYAPRSACSWFHRTYTNHRLHTHRMVQPLYSG